MGKLNRKINAKARHQGIGKQQQHQCTLYRVTPGYLLCTCAALVCFLRRDRSYLLWRVAQDSGFSGYLFINFAGYLANRLCGIGTGYLFHELHCHTSWTVVQDSGFAGYLFINFAGYLANRIYNMGTRYLFHILPSLASFIWLHWV